MWGRHAGEWGRSGGVQKKVLESGLYVLRTWVCGVVGDVKEESVLGGRIALFLPRWFVSIHESSFEEGSESFGGAAALAEAAVEPFQVVKTIIGAGS